MICNIFLLSVLHFLLLEYLKTSRRCTLTNFIGTKTGAWLNTIPKSYNGTELSPSKFRDHLHMQYYCAPLDLNTHCDGCGEKFTVQHVLACKVGGLVTMQQNKVKEELASLCAKAFNPSAVRDERLIISSKKTRITEKNNTIVDTSNEDRGDI